MLEQLVEISAHYDCILIDTCALFSPLTDLSYKSIGEKIERSKETRNSAIFFREQIQDGQKFYVTPLATEKYTPPGYSLKKRIKNRDIPESEKKLGLYRAIKKENKERRRLIDLLEQNNLIPRLDKRETRIYDSFCQIYSKLREMYGLNEINFDFLITGIFLFETDSSCALISNNFHIMKAWREIVLNRRLNFKDFGFYFRKEFNGFERAHGNW